MNRGAYGFPARTDPVPWARPFPAQPTWIPYMGQDNGNTNANSGQMDVSAVKVYRPIVADGIAVRLSNTPAASLDMWAVIYANDPDGFAPTDLLLSVSATGVTTGGFKTWLINDLYMAPGIYWVGGLHVSSTSAQQMWETRRLGQTNAQIQPWETMDHGTGTGTSANAGNDGSAFRQQSLTAPPSRFGGTKRGESNSPIGVVWFELRVRAA